MLVPYLIGVLCFNMADSQIYLALWPTPGLEYLQRSILKSPWMQTVRPLCTNFYRAIGAVLLTMTFRTPCKSLRALVSSTRALSNFPYDPYRQMRAYLYSVIH